MKGPRKSKPKRAAASPSPRSKPLHIPLSFDEAVAGLTAIRPKKDDKPESPSPQK